MKKSILFTIAISVFCSVPASTVAQAFVKSASAEVNAGKKTKKYKCHLISRGEAINRAKRKVKGKVVGVQLSERGSRSVYKVRMLLEQKRVKTVSISACK